MSSDRIPSRPIRLPYMSDAQWQLQIQNYELIQYPYSKECAQCGCLFRWSSFTPIPPMYCREVNCVSQRHKYD
jgi:hypothetical protein